MLFLRDENGIVMASVPGLARRTNVTVEECREALKWLSSPDPDSHMKAFDGRRIEEVDCGWKILQCEDYGAPDSAAVRRQKNRERMALVRAERKASQPQATS